MAAISSDTSLDAERVQIEMLRHAPAWRKFAMVAQLNQTVHNLTLEGLRQRYPEASANELSRRLADLLLGPELAARVYGTPPGE